MSSLPRNFPRKLWMSSRESRAVAVLALGCVCCLEPTRFFITKIIGRIGTIEKAEPRKHLPPAKPKAFRSGLRRRRKGLSS